MARARERLGKAALARQVVSTTDIAAEFEQDRVKFNTVIQDYGVTFNTDNTVLSNDVLDKLNAVVALFGMTFTRNGTTSRLELSTEAYSNHTHDYGTLTNKPVLFDGAYASLSAIPTEFNPSVHTHVKADITDFNHIHAFNDATINDTADGTGTQTDTVRETSGVS